MGNKGVGKLAPFGICQQIEVVEFGRQALAGQGTPGAAAQGYLTAHLILDRDAILKDEEIDYAPTVGKLDGTVAKSTGTTITLRGFAYRRVPTIEEFSRQLAQRFGVKSGQLENRTHRLHQDPERQELQDDGGRVRREDDGKYEDRFQARPKAARRRAWRSTRTANPYEGNERRFLLPGRNYPVSGWIAYAKEPYKDDLMAGVRIYCRGKIAAQTNLFNRKAGFTGEHDVRSYLVGSLTRLAGRDEDLIQTDRRDILWSHELGQQFEEWGQSSSRRSARAPAIP